MSNEYPFESIYSIQGVLLAPFVSVGLMLFFLGFYFLLFGLVVYFILTRENMVNRKLHLCWMVALFTTSVLSSVFGAAVTIQEAALAFRAASADDFDGLEDWVTVNYAPRLILDAFQGMLYVIANCIADTILLYRCFVIWGSAKRAFIIPFFILFATNVVGFVGHIIVYAAKGQLQYDIYLKGSDMDMAYNIANAANTLLMTIFIAGRIWWITRDAREFMGQKIDRKYKRIVYMLIESGFLYSATLLTNVVLQQFVSVLGFGITLNLLVQLMVGIAPTLIFLRTSFGLNDSAVPDSRMLSTLRFGEAPVVDTREHHSVALQQGSIDGSSDRESQKVERSEINGV